jgi:hypothetical protein
MANNKDEQCRLVSIGKSADSCFVMGGPDSWAIGVNLNSDAQHRATTADKDGTRHIPGGSYDKTFKKRLADQG